MSTLEEVAEAVATRLRGIPGLNGRPYVPGSAVWPSAFVQPATIDYEGLSSTDADFRLEVVLMVGAAIDQNQMKLYKYMGLEGPHSVPAAIHADRTLGLGDIDALVVRSRLLGQQEQASYQGYGCVFEVTVRL